MKKKPKFKPELIIGGDELAALSRWQTPTGRMVIHVAGNKITAKQALTLAEWLKDAAKVVKGGKR